MVEVEVDDVVNQLMAWPHRLSDDDESLGNRSATRTAPGTYELDYDDPDRLFVVSVHVVARRRLPLPEPVVVAEHDGLAWRLVGVVVDTQVRLELDVAPSARREELDAEYAAACQTWVPHTRDGEVDPPQLVVEQWMEAQVAISDDAETTYGFTQGRAGGSGTEWFAVRAYAPSPPSAATSLTLTLQAFDAAAVEVSLPLP